MDRLRAPLLAMMVATALGMAVAHAQVQPAGSAAPLQFSDIAEETRFHALTAELRCVMCQNQSLADSNAQIAQDMRREVLALMREGKSDAQVKQFLVDRYGEFVLYRPEVGAHTWLLWFGPGLFLLGGAAAVTWIVRRRANAATAVRSDNTADPHAADPHEEQEW